MNKIIENQAEIIVNYLNTNQFEIAEKKSKKLLKEFPNYLPAYNLAGLSLLYSNKFTEAAKYFNLAIEKKPDYNPAITNLALTYRKNGEFRKAEFFYKKSISINPKSVESLNNLGSLYRDLNQFEDAVTFFKKSVDIKNNLYLTHYNLGVSLQNIGKFDEAQDHLFKSLGFNPEFTYSHTLLSMGIKYKDKNNVHYKMLEKQLKEMPDDKIEKAHIFFGLAKANEDLKDNSLAFDYYLKANKLMKKYRQYDLEKEKNYFKDLKSLFTKENSELEINKEKNSFKLIFILGMPRSGTSLIEQIISNHKLVYGAGELSDLSQIITPNVFDKKHKLIEFKNLNKLKSFCEFLRNEYFNKLQRFDTSKKKIITDKAPKNFRWIGFIKLAFPDAKIIHCVRNPKDICLSIYKNYFVDRSMNYSYDLKEIGKYYNIYEDLLEHYRNIFPNFIYNISYEKLIENKEEEIKKMLSFCGLEWDKNCLEHYKNKRGITTASVSQARSPIYKSSINTWKKFEVQLSPLLKELKK